VQHNLQQLGPLGFQDLAAALTLAECGGHIQVLGSGRDGGRDMYCKGVIVWSGTVSEPGESWDGYTVFQVKHKARLTGDPQRDAAWLWQEVRSELTQWADPESGRGNVPNYLVFITNVPLSPVPRTGGLATLNKNINDFLGSLSDSSADQGGHTGGTAKRLREAKRDRMFKLRAWRFWDANQVDALLTAHAGVRRAFGGFLTVPDVFAHLADFTDKLPISELEPGLRRHARTALMGERSIYFDEAGSSIDTGTPIEKMAIDLPLTPGPDGKKRTVFGYVLDRGERVLRPRLGLHKGPRHLVIAGAPGNGKTTVSKFLVQAYRAALLAGDKALGPDHQAVIDGTDETLRRLGRELPKHRRWPMRIDLAEYVEEGGLVEDTTLMRWIATKVSKRSNMGDITPNTLMSWMKQWPWFLILDGLDEVTEPMTRKRLIARIIEFVSDADGDDCDLFVVLTTRPTGYVENIAPTQFERVDLSRLEVNQAVHYGIRMTRIRLKDDADKIDRVEKELRRAAESESLRKLMQTPLQVLIMTIIVEGAGRLAPDRYSLFWGYYETVFKRERSKRAPFASLLQEHALHILELHQRVGFELQVHSELTDGALAVMKPDELRDIAWHVMHEAGFKPSDRDVRLLDEIVNAATHRLVLLAPRGDNGLGFDVRSLQELMAARYLTTGSTTLVTSRLNRVAASPHWRNAWVFAAGRWFSDPQPHQHEAIVELVENVDRNASDRLGSICPVGPFLALDLIEDGMARSHPRFYDRILVEGLRVLQLPNLPDPLAVARILVRAADMNDRTRGIIAEAMRDGLGGTESARDTTKRVQYLVPSAAQEAGVGSNALMLRGVRRRASDASSVPGQPQPDVWREFQDSLLGWPESDAIAHKLADAGASLVRLRGSRLIEQEMDTIMAALSDPVAASILELALDQVVDAEPLLISDIRDGILPVIQRQSVGDTVRL
jgi:hypothetical protein